MPFDEALAARIRRLTAGRRGFVEKTMFGGVGFLLNGNMCVGVWKDSLVARVGPAKSRSALSEPYVREFDITGKSTTGWVLVGPGGVADEDQLTAWVSRASKFVSTLPAK
jgi:hypothetical protein